MTVGRNLRMGAAIPKETRLCQLKLQPRQMREPGIWAVMRMKIPRTPPHHQLQVPKDMIRIIARRRESSVLLRCRRRISKWKKIGRLPFFISWTLFKEILLPLKIKTAIKNLETWSQKKCAWFVNYFATIAINRSQSDNFVMILW